MASPCEILIRADSTSEAATAASLLIGETRRIEQQFSRYKTDNLVYRINTANGVPVALDDETDRLLAFASNCFELSSGLFDITSGVLRLAWSFDGTEIVPNQEKIDELLQLVGWPKVNLTDNSITLRPGMQIDFGGLGKEYAVDRVAQLAVDQFGRDVLVNFGGDIRAIATAHGEPWRVGIEDPARIGDAQRLVELIDGAVTTSGNSYRYCIVNGRRLGHLLNPITGWPVSDMPDSVTVIGSYCLQAGFLSSVAMLHGAEAEAFLGVQDVASFCSRGGQTRECSQHHTSLISL